MRERRWWLAVACCVAVLTALFPAWAGTAFASSPFISSDPGVTNSCDQSVAPGHFTCFAVRLNAATDLSTKSFRAYVASSESGFGPADLQAAYDVRPTTDPQQVYIIVAFDYPNAEQDLATYRSHYGLPACTTGNGCFRKLNQSGDPGNYPVADTGWAQEAALDLDMVSAACPNCKITLVEANDTGDGLVTAVATATDLGAKVVSMSWGGDEAGGGQDPNFDAAYFSSPGVVYAAASGDTGEGAKYPATSPDVLAVGGTSLVPDPTTARGWSETVWNSGSQSDGTLSATGSGCSVDEPKPTWQVGVVPDAVCPMRTADDVAAVADPDTGVAVYYGSGWSVYGGTSAATPFIAGVAAQATPLTAGVTAPAQVYANGAEFNDVTTGTNAPNCVSLICRAGVGWDGPTGVGTPAGIAAFEAAPTPSPTPTPTVCEGQLLTNPGFESGARHWSVAARVPRSTLAHHGRRFVRLDGTDRAHTDVLARKVHIPAGCRATLTYFVRVRSVDRTRKVHDILRFSVAGKVLQERSNRNHGRHYVKLTVNLSRYAGHTVALRWAGHENTGKWTSFLIDDVTLGITS